ncbi:MAG: hypothetical protein ACXWVZ_02515 [Kaistella sp.]
MKKLALLLMLISTSAFSQTEKKVITEIMKFQTDLNKGYTNKTETPLRGAHFLNFK